MVPLLSTLRSTLLLIALPALLVGCSSGRLPVTGKVVYADGSPVTEGSIIGEANIEGKPIGLQGEIASDGTFSLGTVAPGDGAPPGSYRFVVMPRALGDSELAEGKLPAVDAKYTSFDSSGISLEVEKGKKNELNITVTKPKAKR